MRKNLSQKKIYITNYGCKSRKKKTILNRKLSCVNVLISQKIKYGNETNSKFV